MAMLSKAELRDAARARRKPLPGFAAALAGHAGALALPSGSMIGGYHALKDEADPSLLLARLVEQGCSVAFPRVAGKDAALEFHLVPDGDVLRPGSFGVHEPLAHWPRVAPDMLLVPLLAFDAHGTRLGYGGGYYDRTLADLKQQGAVAIGVAFADQEIPAVPREAHDIRLDMILTERGLRRFLP